VAQTSISSTFFLQLPALSWDRHQLPHNKTCFERTGSLGVLKQLAPDVDLLQSPIAYEVQKAGKCLIFLFSAGRETAKNALHLLSS